MKMRDNMVDESIKETKAELSQILRKFNTSLREYKRNNAELHKHTEYFNNITFRDDVIEKINMLHFAKALQEILDSAPKNEHLTGVYSMVNDLIYDLKTEAEKGLRYSQFIK